MFSQVQGMSFIAAVLILNLDTADAFIAFANLLNKPCQMAFFRVDHSLVSTQTQISTIRTENLHLHIRLITAPLGTRCICLLYSSVEHGDCTVLTY